MRWFWVDRFVEIQKGKSAKAIKNVSLSEEHLHDHFPGFPVMPPSLMIESMAQTSGVLVGHANDFEQNVILAKIPRVEFFDWVRPGDQILFEAEITELRPEGATVKTWGTVDGKKVTEGEIIFFHVGSKKDGNSDFKFVFTPELMQAFNLNNGALKGQSS